MIFSSLVYLLFLAAFAGVLAQSHERARFWLCLVGSYVFYASWHPAYVLLIVGVGTIGWYCGARAAYSQGKARKRWSWSGIVILLMALVVFRTPAILEMVDRMGRELLHLAPSRDHARPSIPLGLSFFIFEAIS